MFTEFAYENDQQRRKKGVCIKKYRAGTNGEFFVEKWSCERVTEEHYATVFCPCVLKMNESEFESAAKVIADELFALLCAALPSKKGTRSILLAGLGNPSLTVDSIGPKTAQRVSVTRLFSSSALDFSLAAMIPGVPCGTGMETAEQLFGVVRAISPDAMIVVDSLAAKDYRRIGCTVQMGNAGISPGSGIGADAMAINRQTMGIPVIAIGVPTVVDAAILLEDMLVRGGIDKDSCEVREALSENRGYFVCPKESDLICDAASFLLARAVDLLCQGHRKDERGIY